MDMPHVPTTGGYILVIYCLFCMTVCAVLAVRPESVFKVLALGRPTPRLLERPWVRTFYRVTAVGIFEWLGKMLIVALRP
jgi:hypothetical protein